MERKKKCMNKLRVPPSLETFSLAEVADNQNQRNETVPYLSSETYPFIDQPQNGYEKKRKETPTKSNLFFFYRVSNKMVIR